MRLKKGHNNLKSKTIWVLISWETQVTYSCRMAWARLQNTREVSGVRSETNLGPGHGGVTWMINIAFCNNIGPSSLQERKLSRLLRERETKQRELICQNHHFDKLLNFWCELVVLVWCTFASIHKSSSKWQSVFLQNRLIQTESYLYMVVKLKLITWHVVKQ